MDTAVIELDALADAVRAAAQHHDLGGLSGRGLTLLFVGGVQVGRAGRELRGAGVHPLEGRLHAEGQAPLAHFGLRAAGELRQALVREAVPLQAPERWGVQRGEARHGGFGLHQALDLDEKPRIDVRRGMYVRHRHAGAKGVRDEEDAVGARLRQLVGEAPLPRFRLVFVQQRIQAVLAGLQSTQRLLQGFLERAADGHHLAHGLHLRGEAIRDVGELLEGEARHLGDHIVDGWLERRRGDAGDVVGQLIERVAHRELRRHLGDGKAGGLGRQRRGARHARIHLDDDHAAAFWIDGELHVGAAGFDADLPQHGDGGVAQALIFLVRERLRRRHGDGVASVDAHGIHVLDGADDDAVVAPVAHHLHLELLPAQQGFVDEQFAGGRKVEPAPADGHELFAVVGDAAAAAAQSERGPDDAGKAEPPLHLQRFLQAVGDGRARRLQADARHGLDEALAILGLVDGVLAGADELDALRLQHPFAHQIQSAVEGRLATHGGQQRIGALRLDDARHGAPFHRLDVGGVRQRGIRHDGGRVGVHQHHPVALVRQRLAGLGAGIVELAGLADDDGAGAQDEDGLEIVALGHRRQPLGAWLATRGVAVARRSAIKAMNASKRYAQSCGPGLASGWP